MAWSLSHVIYPSALILFIDRKKMSLVEQRKSFVFGMPYETRLDMIRAFLRIYNGYLDYRGMDQITERSINLLSFYVCYGYSDETRLRYMDCYGQKDSYVSVLNNDLKKGGFLEDRKGSNYRTRNLSRDMLNFRNYFVLDGDGDDTRVLGFVFKRRPVAVGGEDA